MTNKQDKIEATPLSQYVELLQEFRAAQQAVYVTMLAHTEAGAKLRQAQDANSRAYDAYEASTKTQTEAQTALRNLTMKHPEVFAEFELLHAAGKPGPAKP